MGYGAVHGDSLAPFYHELCIQSLVGWPAAVLKQRGQPGSGPDVWCASRRAPLFFVRHLALSTPRLVGELDPVDGLTL